MWPRAGCPKGRRPDTGRMAVTSLGFRTDLMVLSLGGSTIDQRDGHLVVRTPSNPTFWWGNFLLLAEPIAPGAVPRLLELYTAELPDAAHVAWGIDSTDGTAGADDELAEAGFSIGRDTVLTASALRAPARSTSATLRSLAGDDDWRQALDLHVSTNSSDPGVTHDFLAAQVADQRALCDRGHANWYGAFEDGALCSSLGIVTDGGELARFQVVETHPDTRRRGFASALVYHAGQTAFERGAKRLVIVADPECHAIRIYESLGFVAAERQVQLTRRPAVA
jgi:GNAT superfamily N-acetyltransferase